MCVCKRVHMHPVMDKKTDLKIRDCKEPLSLNGKHETVFKCSPPRKTTGLGKRSRATEGLPQRRAADKETEKRSGCKISGGLSHSLVYKQTACLWVRHKRRAKKTCLLPKPPDKMLPMILAFTCVTKVQKMVCKN